MTVQLPEVNSCDYKITFASHILAGFCHVPQSCTSVHSFVT